MSDLGVFWLAMLSVAAHSLWFIWLTQEIARPFRDRLSRCGRWMKYLANCPICVSVWAGAAALGLWLAGTPGRAILLVLAVSNFVMTWNSLRSIADAQVESYNIGLRARSLASREKALTEDKREFVERIEPTRVGRDGSRNG